MTRTSFLDTYLWECLKPVFNSRFLSNDLYLGCKSSSSLPRQLLLCVFVSMWLGFVSQRILLPGRKSSRKLLSDPHSLAWRSSFPHNTVKADLLVSYSSLSKRKLLSSGGPTCVRWGPKRSEDSLLEPVLPGLETKCHLSSKLFYFKLLFAFLVLISFPLINGYV